MPHASPDGRFSRLARTMEGAGLGARGRPPRELASLAPNEVFAGWSADPSRLYVVGWTGPKGRVEALDVTSGRRTFVREITIDDPAGMLMTMPDLFLSADASSYVYGYTRMLSTLYLVTGLK